MDLREASRRRAERVKTLMGRNGFDALLLTDVRAEGYVGNIYLSQPWLKLATCFPLRQEPAVVAHRVEVPRVKHESWIKDARDWDVPKRPYESVIAEFFKSTGLEAGVLGIEFAALQAGTYLKLKELLPRAQFRDATPLLNEAMLVKDHDEVACLRRAAEIADTGVRAGLDGLGVGKTETEIAGIMEGAMRRAGAEFFWSATQVGAGQRVFDFIDVSPSGNRVRAGDPVRLDVQPAFGLYAGDLSIPVVFGRATPEYRAMCAAAADAALAMVHAMAPGTPVKEVVRAYNRVIERAGFSGYSARDIGYPPGHGLGIQGQVRTPPSFFEDDPTIVQENMAAVIFPQIFKPGVGGVSFEFAVLVGPREAEVLTGLPIALAEVPVAS